MGIISFSIPKEIVYKIINKVNIDNFIETGTFRGNTCSWAAEHFKNVATIEIQPETYNETSKNLAHLKNIEFYLGNSKDCLPEICKKMEGRSLFWLDGHWCGGSGDKLDDECPLLDELEAISILNDAIIFIDDARCFIGPMPPPHSDSWPYLDDIFAFTKEKFPNHFTTIIDDVIMCVPKDVKPIITKYWEETFNERYYSNNESTKIEEKIEKSGGVLKRLFSK